MWPGNSKIEVRIASGTAIKVAINEVKKQSIRVLEINLNKYPYVIKLVSELLNIEV